MYMFSYSTVLILMTKLFPIIATPVLLDNFSIDPSAQLDTDEADPDVGLPLQQTSEDTVSLDQANQNSFGSTIKDLSWLASTAQNDPVAPIPAGAIAKVTTDSTHSCGDATWKRAETKACPAPAATKEEEEQPQCLWGLIPFCCSSINKRGNPTNCLRCTFHPFIDLITVFFSR